MSPTRLSCKSSTVPPDFEGLEDSFRGDCVSLSSEELEGYNSTEKVMTHRMFRRYFTRAAYNALSELFKYEVDPRAGLTLKKDWHVSFGWGYLNGERVVCFYHSQIHYFYKASEAVQK